MDKGKKQLGKEIHITVGGCPKDILNSADYLKKVIYESCNILKVKICSMTEHIFSPQGVSIVAILAESHFAIHTWPEINTATIDIFTCGEKNPEDIVGFLGNKFSASKVNIDLSNRATNNETYTDNVKRYPNFPDYILSPTPGGNFPNPEFRRGVGREYILEAEGISWQQFFSSEEYSPPTGKDILLLHPCTWSKPYDFSYYGTMLRKVTDNYPRIHRVVVSNVGVVPYEYQMNPFFCSYDYMDLSISRSKTDIKRIRTEYFTITQNRILKYIKGNMHNYKAFILFAHPIPGGYCEAVIDFAQKNQIPGFLAPDIDTYLKGRSETTTDADIDAPLFSPSVLDRLGSKIDELELWLSPEEK